MSLAHLPAELLHATLVHLAPEDLAAVAAASRTLKAAAYDERLWAAAMLRRPQWQKCGATIGATSARLRYAQTRTRCEQCLQRTIPVRWLSYDKIEELRRRAHIAMSLSIAHKDQILAASTSSGVSVAVWPTRHGARVWIADASRLDGDVATFWAVSELRTLCTRRVPGFDTRPELLEQGWTPLIGGGDAALPWSWDYNCNDREWDELEKYLIDAASKSELADMPPYPPRAASLEGRLHLGMRAKEIAIERVLLDGDCVFGFSLEAADIRLLSSGHLGGHDGDQPYGITWARVVVCQLSTAPNVERVVRITRRSNSGDTLRHVKVRYGSWG